MSYLKLYLTTVAALCTAAAFVYMGSPLLLLLRLKVFGI